HTHTHTHTHTHGTRVSQSIKNTYYHTLTHLHTDTRARTLTHTHTHAHTHTHCLSTNKRNCPHSGVAFLFSTQQTFRSSSLCIKNLVIRATLTNQRIEPYDQH